VVKNFADGEMEASASSMLGIGCTGR
jgi:hypothetical protein